MYFKNLDASRFFAFILVFLAHCFVSTDSEIQHSNTFQFVYSWGKVGVLGLEYFFVLSSFLISMIIFTELDETKEFSVKNFLIRRSLRVWPLYFLILLIGLIVSVSAGLFNADLEPLPPWPYLVFFVVNFYIIEHGTEFLFFIAFLWSISIEEQFYIAWSFLIKFLSDYFVHFCYLMILASLLFRVLNLEDSRQLYFNTVSALGNFGVGGLLAFGLHNRHRLIRRVILIPKKYVAIIYVLLVLSIIFYHQLSDNDVFSVFSRLYFSLFFAYVILEQAEGRYNLFNFGRKKIFTYLGKISYGLYCFHGVVITLLLQALPMIFPEQNGFMVYFLFPVVIFILTVLVSHLSYRYFERYFLKLKKRFYTFRR